MSQSQGPGSVPPSSSRPPSERSVPPPPPPPGYAPMMMAPPRASLGTRLLTSLIVSVLMASIVANIYFVLIVAAQFRGLPRSTYAEGDATHNIVIVPVSGVIEDETAAFIRKALAELEKAPPKAIILRVDSGGGGVAASDRIWHEIEEFKKRHGDKTKLVASYGSMAASGGYYISANADFIIAEPTCITGSIGVIAPAFTVDKLLEKIGVTPETITATASTEKDVANNVMRPWTDKDRNALRVVLDHMCDRFVEVVSKGRTGKLTEEEVRKLANGQFMTAANAKDAKLIDDIGYLDDAIDKAKSLAGMATTTKPEVTVIHPSRSSPLSLLLGYDNPPTQSLNGDTIRRWAAELTVPRVEFRVAP